MLSLAIRRSQTRVGRQVLLTWQRSHWRGCILPLHTYRHRLAFIIAKTDAASLAALRRELLRPPYTAMETAAGAAAGVAVVAGAACHIPH